MSTSLCVRDIVVSFNNTVHLFCQFNSLTC